MHRKITIIKRLFQLKLNQARYLFLSTFLFWSILSQSETSQNFFKKAFSCTPRSHTSPCESKSSSDICKAKLASCKALINSQGIDPSLERFLINCDTQEQCDLQDYESLIAGCSTLSKSSWLKVEAYLKNVKAKLSEIEISCAHSSGGRTDIEYRNCLFTKLPSLHFPTNLNFLLNAASHSINALTESYNSVTAWIKQNRANITNDMKRDCLRYLNKSDQSYSRCQFNTFMNSLLASLEQPYSKSNLKTITDLLTETYVLKVSEHLQSKGCLTPEGTGREFCALLAVMSVQSANIALEVADYIPQPKSIAKGITKELLEEGKELTSKIANTTPELEDRVPDKQQQLETNLNDTKTKSDFRRSNGNKYPKEVRQKLLQNALKSNDEIQKDIEADFSLLLGQRNPENLSKKTNWPKTEKEKLQAQKLTSLYQQGQKFDFNTRDPIVKAAIMKHFKKVADQYAEIYRSSGYKVRIQQLESANPNELGGYQVVLDASSNPQVNNLLTKLDENLDIQEVAISIDQNFYNKDMNPGAGFSNDNPKQVQIDAMGAQDPSHLLINDQFFHEIHHGFYDKAKNDRKNLPYYGEANIEKSKNSLVTMDGYKQYFAAEETASYKKQLAILQSEKITPINIYSDFSTQISKPNRIAQMAINYRESARSTLRIIDNIEKTMAKNSKNFFKSIKYDTHHILDVRPSTAKIPLYDSNNHKVGDFSISLIDLNLYEESDKEAMVKAYLQQMKNAATKDYLDAQAKIDFLKDQVGN
jgi:hypothetical protein